MTLGLDLIIIDGGKGQLSASCEILKKLKESALLLPYPLQDLLDLYPLELQESK